MLAWLASLANQLDLSLEDAAQRYADKLEEKLSEGRKREASLARALGYAEAQRDQLMAHSRSWSVASV